jgi:hypothetical protein
MASSPLGTPYPENPIRSSFAPASNTVRAALVERERLLIESLRLIGEAPYRHRLKIESELGDIRRRLQRLASQAQRNGARLPDRRPEVRKDPGGKGAPVPPVSRVPEPETKKRQQTPPRPPLCRLYDRLVAMCVVETTAASYSGMRSWKTEPCRLLLRLIAKPAVPQHRSDEEACSEAS